MQISADEYIDIRRRRDKQKSRYEQGETSKGGATKPRVTSWILLNKWQRQKEKDYQRWLEEQEYQRKQEKERYEKSKLNHIGIVLSLKIAGMKVWNCLPEIIAQSVLNNIGSLGNLKPTVGLSMLELSIIMIIWIAA